jgi:hypothetical protein
MRALRLLLPMLALVAAAGCNEYHYYDLNVTFNGATASGGFAANEPARIQVCVMTVSGEDSGSLRIGPNMQNLPLQNGSTTLGIVEFSTFADSGTLNFKMECYAASNTVPNCKVGEGTKSIMATTASTVMDTLVVNKMGDFALCP